MIQTFNNTGTEDLFNGRHTKAVSHTCLVLLWKVAARKLDQLDSVTSLEQLKLPRRTSMIRVPTHWPPTHPGEMLLEEFLIPMPLSQRALAKTLQVPYSKMNALATRRARQLK